MRACVRVFLMVVMVCFFSSSLKISSSIDGKYPPTHIHKPPPTHEPIFVYGIYIHDIYMLYMHTCLEDGEDPQAGEGQRLGHVHTLVEGALAQDAVWSNKWSWGVRGEEERMDR